MASDQLVTSRMVLDAVLELRRLGAQRFLEQLEQIEPDLAAYLMETMSTIHAALLELRGRPRQTARTFREIEALVLICITALRKAGYEAWRRSVAETDLARIDPSLRDRGDGRVQAARRRA